MVVDTILVRKLHVGKTWLCSRLLVCCLVLLIVRFVVFPGWLLLIGLRCAGSLCETQRDKAHVISVLKSLLRHNTVQVRRVSALALGSVHRSAFCLLLKVCVFMCVAVC